jgi:hypothetical protein
MMAAIHRARAHDGPDLVRAAVALVIAGACIGLLIFMLTPQPGDAMNGGASADQLHWRAPTSDSAAKLIPI